MEDEDELLYGDTSIDINLSLSEPSKPEPTPQPEMLFKAPPKKVVEPTHWALITTKDHKLEASLFVPHLMHSELLDFGKS